MGRITSDSNRWKESKCFLPTEIAGDEKTVLKRNPKVETYNEVCLNGNGKYRYDISWLNMDNSSDVCLLQVPDFSKLLLKKNPKPFCKFVSFVF